MPHLQNEDEDLQQKRKLNGGKQLHSKYIKDGNWAVIPSMMSHHGVAVWKTICQVGEDLKNIKTFKIGDERCVHL